MKPARQPRHSERTPPKNSEYRQIKQTLTVLKLLASRGPQPAVALARTLDLHERTLDRFMRALAKQAPVYLRTVPGSGNPASWWLDVPDFLQQFNNKREVLK